MEYIDTPRDLAAAARQLARDKDLRLDCETTGLSPVRDSILLVGINDFAISGRLDLSPLAGPLADNSKPTYVFNASFDGGFLFQRGLRLYRVFDPMLGAKILKCGLAPTTGGFTLDNLLRVCLGVTLPDKATLQLSFVGQDPTTFSPTQEQIDYLARDLAYLPRLSAYMQDLLEQRGLVDTWRLENAMSQVIAEMECRGIPINRETYEPYLAQLEVRREQLLADLQEELTPAIMEVRLRVYQDQQNVRQLWETEQEVHLLAAGRDWDHDHPDGTKAERRKYLLEQQRLWRAAGHKMPPRPKISPEPINPGSGSQLKAAFNELGVQLDDAKRVTLLRAKLNASPAVQRVLQTQAEFSTVEKQLSTYGREMLAGLDADGRLRTSYTQILSTGRMASSRVKDQSRKLVTGANVQNIPPNTRAHVNPQDGYVFVIGDYSQIELRIAAEWALRREPQANDALIRAFRDDADPHAEMAITAFNLDPQAFTEALANHDPLAQQQRAAGKTTNFSALFGIAASTLALRIHDSFLKLDPDFAEPLTQHNVDEAKQLLKAFWKLNPVIQRCLAEWRAQALNDGYTVTLLGRRRLFARPERFDPEYQQKRGKIEREAGNQPIQGTGADIVKLACVQAQRDWHHKGWDVWLLNQVHDEIMVECPEELADEVRTSLHQHMVSAAATWLTMVPIKVSIDAQLSWTHA